MEEKGQYSSNSQSVKYFSACELASISVDQFIEIFRSFALPYEMESGLSTLGITRSVKVGNIYFFLRHILLRAGFAQAMFRASKFIDVDFWRTMTALTAAIMRHDDMLSPTNRYWIEDNIDEFYKFAVTSRSQLVSIMTEKLSDRFMTDIGSIEKCAYDMNCKCFCAPEKKKYNPSDWLVPDMDDADAVALAMDLSDESVYAAEIDEASLALALQLTQQFEDEARNAGTPATSNTSTSNSSTSSGL